MHSITSAKSRSHPIIKFAVQAVLHAAVLQAVAAQAQQVTSTEAAASESLQEITVTAQRREERLRDVPISVSVQTGLQLEQAGIKDTRDLTVLTPGLKIDQLGAFTQPSIRGITSEAVQSGNDSNVAIYLDGVYQPSQQANAFDLPDIERVEVLKGPQGTLFGRNATGGAIRVFTKDPVLNRTTGNVGISYGNYNDIVFKEFVSTPISPIAAVSLASYYEDRDGYDNDLLHGGKIGYLKSRLVRAKVLLEPTEDLTMKLTAYYSHRVDQAAFAGLALNQNTLGRAIPGATGPFPTKPWDVALDDRFFFKVDSFGTSFDLKYKTSVGTISSLSSYTSVKPELDLDGDYSPTPVVDYYQKQPEWALSEELQFVSDRFGFFSFVLGTFIYMDEGKLDPQRVPVGGGSFYYSWGEVTTKAPSLFGEAYFDITDRLQFIAGARYSYEYKKLSGINGINVPQPNPRPTVGDVHWDKVTPRASLRYALTSRSNVYATYNEGFKSGAYDNSSMIPIPVNPEFVRAYEIGYKSNDLNWLDLDVALFYYLYKNQQVQAHTDVNGVPLAILQNAASSRIYGADIDATVHATREFNIRAGLSLLHSRYERYPSAILDVPTGFGGNKSVTKDASGNQTIRSPDWTLTLTANYNKEFDSGKLTASLTAYHTDKFYFEAGDRVGQPQYTTLASEIGWAFGDTGFQASLYGRNLTNKAYIQSAFVTDLADGAAYAPPRMYGFNLNYRF